MKKYYVYIMASKSRVLYTGVTNNLERRVYEHKNKLVEGFTSKYNINQLVHYEETNDVQVALAREKQIKGWLRAKKIALNRVCKPAMERFEFGMVCNTVLTHYIVCHAER